MREMMLEELRKVIPSFLQRLDRPESGGEWAAYLASTRRETERWSSASGRTPQRPSAIGRPTARAARRPRSRGRGQGTRGDVLRLELPRRRRAAPSGEEAWL